MYGNYDDKKKDGKIVRNKTDLQAKTLQKNRSVLRQYWVSKKQKATNPRKETEQPENQ
jgi:hypothetical protein